MGNYTVILPEELTTDNKVQDIHTQVVTQGSSIIFSFKLAGAGETDGPNFIENENPQIIKSEGASSIYLGCLIIPLEDY
jgi:hypothetical protein